MTREALPPFTVNTADIPEMVDPSLARIRNGHIEAWRRGELDAQATLRRLLRLYWRTQTTTNPETNFYLIDVSYEFPVEASMSIEESGKIWQEELGKTDQ